MPPPPDFANLTVLCADSSPPLAAEVEGALKEIGVRDVWLAGSLAETRERLAEAAFDLLVGGTAWGDGDFGEVIRAARHGQAGDNPYLTVVVVGPDRETPAGWRAVGAGADALISRPVSTDALRACLEGLVDGRKRFVVTSDYIGPDRRSESGRESAIPLIEVPNTLRDKAHGTYDGDAVAHRIDELAAEINIQKLQRHVEKISYLINRIGPDMMVDGVDEKVRTFLDELIFVAEDIQRRVRGSHLESVTDTCGPLVKATERVHRQSGIPRDRDFKNLVDSADGVIRSFAAAAAGR